MEAKGRKRLTGYVPDYVVFDFETTGLSPAADDIIEISAVKAKDGNVTATFSALVNPGRPIPKAASAVNGITDDMVENAPKLSQALSSFLEFIGDGVLIGHNIQSFDLKFLDSAVSKCGKNKVENDYIDTLFMARNCLKELPRHRLTDLAEYFHISTEGAHRALKDCMINQKCYEEMGKQLKARKTDPDIGLCPRCGSGLVKRNGRFGAFFGCSNFPDCRFTKNG
ncbi:MAG: DNA polymerase III subunit epsilon [Lachnospiraceae bacterium]|jgi:DNA polymerase-3 subunit epsilon|nr:DNA polymerase III subunit epsilon [Lachnospiraceae bacterium]